MRTILMIVLLAVVVVIILIVTNVIDINQTETASLPRIEMEGGNAPEFDVDTADIDVGTETREVEVPTIDIEGADEAAEEGDR